MTAPKILLVDDNVELHDMLKTYMERDGVEVAVANNAEAGVAAALSDDFKLVVLDAMMPRMNGLEALSRIRMTSRVPVLMLTAKGDDADRIVGHELGADADLQGAALHLFLWVVDQCLRAQSPGAGTSARLGAVAFIHRVGSTLNPHLHLHCVVIDGVFASDPAGGVIFHAAIGLDANAIAAVQECVRGRLLRVFVRRGLLPRDDAGAMGHWTHGGGFSVDGSVRIEAADRAGRERLLRYDRRKSPGGTAPARRSPWDNQLSRKRSSGPASCRVRSFPNSEFHSCSPEPSGLFAPSRISSSHDVHAAVDV